MKPKFTPRAIALSFLLVIFSCSSDSESEEANSFNFTVEIEKLNFGVDELVVFDIVSEENLSRIDISLDIFSDRIGGQGFSTTNDQLGRQIRHSYRFPTTGQRTITVIGTDMDGRTSEYEFQINVDLSSTVKINGIRINSFAELGETYDPEFGEDDINRLADLIFVVDKRYTNIKNNENVAGDFDWFITELHENESSLFWDLSNENNVINNSVPFKIWLYDEEPTSVENMFPALGFLTFDFSEFMDSKPSQVIFENVELSLELAFDVEWN